MATPKTSKVNDLLTQLDEAFETAEAQAAALAEVRATASAAIAAQQTALDVLKAEHDAKITEAKQAADDARVALHRLRDQVNERVGLLTGQGTDPRVTVK